MTVVRKSYYIFKLHSLMFLVFLSALTEAQGDCNVCAVASNQACIARNQFKLCGDGVPQGDAYTCPGDQICTLSGNCGPASTNPILISCKSCRECDRTKTFACTGTQDFSLCLGGDSPSPIVGSCSPDLFCNINNPKICGSAAGGYPATCSYQDDIPTSTQPPPTTTPSPATNPDGFCSAINKEGRFPVGTLPDSTCKQYVHCILNVDTWIGALYYCPGETYFDGTTGNCNQVIPARCTGTVRNLALRDLILV